MIQIEHLNKTYVSRQGETHIALTDINLTIEDGSVFGIIGQSGAGKSTLVRCLNLLERPTSGSIIINGRDITSLSEKELRQNHLHFGLVFQSFNLFPQYTVLKNLTLASELLEKKKPNGLTKEQITEHAYDLLREVGLYDKAKSYPCDLSGGQQQRVAIARALSMSPDVLCFDEPTSALDPELTGEVLRVIRELKDTDTTMIIVTHELGFARGVSDRIIFMADGLVEEQGTPEEIFCAPKSEKLKSFLSKSLENAVN